MRSGGSSASSSGVSPARKYSVSPARSHATNLSSLYEADLEQNESNSDMQQSHGRTDPISQVSAQPPSDRLSPLLRVPSIDIHVADDDYDELEFTFESKSPSICSNPNTALSVPSSPKYTLGPNLDRGSRPNIRARPVTLESSSAIADLDHECNQAQDKIIVYTFFSTLDFKTWYLFTLSLLMCS